MKGYSVLFLIFVSLEYQIVITKASLTIRFNRTNPSENLLDSVRCALQMVDLAQGSKYSSQLCQALPDDWDNSQITNNEFTYFNKDSVEYKLKPTSDVTVDVPGGFRPGLPILFHTTTDKNEPIDTISITILKSGEGLLILKASLERYSLGLSVNILGEWSDEFKMTNPFLGNTVLLKLMVVIDRAIKVYLDGIKVYSLDVKVSVEYDQVRIYSEHSKCSRIFFNFVEIID